MDSFRSWPGVHVLFFMTFLVSGLLINLVQGLCFAVFALVLKNRSFFRQVNYYFVWSIYGQLLFLADWWSGSQIRLHGSRDFFSDLGKEHAFIVMNHHYEIDWLYGWMIADRHGVLGNARVCVKKMLRYVPVVGWAWNVSDVIYLARNWDQDKEILASGIQTLCDYPDPMWFLIFAEGTRFNRQKHEASVKFARERGLPVLKHHLVPRTKGFFHALRNTNPDRVRYLYDCTLVFDEKRGAAPTLSSVLTGKAVHGEIFVRKIDMNDIDRTEEGANDFLMRLYQEKDQIKDHYLQHGSFPKEEPYKDYQVEKQKARPFSLVLIVALNILVGFPLLRWAFGMLTSGSVVLMLVPIVIFGAIFVALKKMIGLTKISEGSAYGSKKAQ